MVWSRPVRALIVLALAAAFGFGLYAWLGSLRNPSTLNGKVVAPSQSRALFSLPGTIIVAQDGALYKLQDAQFTQLASGGWTQPTILPDHQHLIAVRRESNYSDLYELSLNGTVERQLTNNASPRVDLNHWSFYPRASPSGAYVFYSYDAKYCAGCYLVDLSVFRQPIDGSQRQARSWSHPNQGTGGDLAPIQLPSGGIIYSKFTINQANNQISSRIWYQRAQGTAGAPLSESGQSCQQPALSPDEARIAMICAPIGATTWRLVVADLALDRLTLGPETVLATGLPAAPAWSPDGRGLIYLAPKSGQTGPFQLFSVQIPAKGKPPAPKAVTDVNNFDPTAAPVWYQ
jgi:Tol biopolymer transport system component